MFAIACWDLKSKSLFLARDRFGEKPLYYGYKNDLFIFASELDSFGEVKAFPLEINKEIIPFYLSRSYIPAPFSIYKDIYKLKPGTYLKINSAEIKGNYKFNPIKYWDLTEELVKNQNLEYKTSDSNLIVNIDYLIRNSIKNQMIA